MPVNEAEIGRQYVEIGRMIHPEEAENGPEQQELEAKRESMVRHGHYIIVRAALEAETNPLVTDDVAQRVIDIAHETGTEPARLEGAMSELTIKQAEHIIHP